MTLERCEARGYDAGLAEGLRAALGDTVPAGYAVVPADAAAGTVIPHRLAAAEGLAIVRRPGPESSDPELAARLAAARIGVSRRVLGGAIRRLEERTSGTVPLLRHQLVIGSVADIVTSIELARAMLGTPYAAHDMITELDWEITMLYGGAGYITDQPTRALYVSALVANVWGAHS
jgi:hypothetical protein